MSRFVCLSLGLILMVASTGCCFGRFACGGCGGGCGTAYAAPAYGGYAPAAYAAPAYGAPGCGCGL